MNEFDRDTGEIIPPEPYIPSERRDPKMPPMIAKACLQIKKAVKQLGFDEKNEHARYSYASVDKFYTIFNPLMVEAGLLLVVDEVDIAYRDGGANREGRSAMWVLPRYDLWLYHESGVAWGPLRRHLALPITGPQNFGAAESYIRKSFMRGMFMVATGEKDADDIAPSDAPPVFDRGRVSRANPAVAAADRGKDHAREAFRRVRDAIDKAANPHSLFDAGDIGEEWAPDLRADVQLIAETQPGAMDLLHERLRQRLKSGAV